jgi:phage-related protein
MPVEVFVFQEEDGSVPLLDWLDDIPERAQIQCFQRIEMLAERGHELRRPHAAHLGDGIHELRTKLFRVQYRILYFFHGKGAVVLSHGLIKERVVPKKDINDAKARRELTRHNPDRLGHL